MSLIRTRFAPSPTGNLHMGSARTALFNWAFARHHGGSFGLRIEDTDRERSTAASEAAVLDGLRWLGIDWDEGPVRQSERREHYDAAIEKLLAGGHAYRCACSAEALAERREQTIAAGNKWVYDGRCRDAGLGPDSGPHTVRLRVDPQSFLDWKDLVFGPSGQSAAEIGDMNIRRSDGHPLYNLAVVVDDLEMGVSHVIRGADHLGNTAFQIALYRALGEDPPAFAHVPLIVGEGGKKLSKRRDPVSVENYRAEGYLPEALLNWLVRIGWSHGDQEIFSSDEMQQLFDLDAVNRSAAQADAEKLGWLNQHYIKALPAERLMQELLPFLEQKTGLAVAPTQELARLADLLRERSRTLAEMAERAAFLVVSEVHFDEKASKKFLKPAARPILADLRARLAGLDSWTETDLEACFEEVRHQHGDVGMGKLAQPVRVAVTGSSASPGIYETLAILGRGRTVSRLEAAIAEIPDPA
jgi:glutamyl-tRNA synthetase